MTSKKLIVLLMATVFTLGVGCAGVSTQEINPSFGTGSSYTDNLSHIQMYGY